MKSRERGVAPRFISFEGGEGAGKTSLMNRLGEVFLRKRVPFLKTREPGGTPFGEQIRRWILHQGASMHFDAKAELMLFLAARAQHIQEKIAPAIRDGVLVLCDRFNDSTIAYQGIGRALGMPWVKALCDLVCGETQPELTFYLDLDPVIGLTRARRTEKENSPSGKLDRIESETLHFHQSIREAFHLIAKNEPERIFIIDASQPIHVVYDTALQLILQRFPHV